MTRYVLILLCLVFSIQSKAQKEIPYGQYKPANKSVHFYADFNTNNDTLWMKVPYEGGHGRIVNGSFLYKVKKDDYLAHDFQPEVDENRDFEVEFAAQIIGENRRNTNGILFWGRADSSYKSHYWYFWTKSSRFYHCKGEGDCEKGAWKWKKTQKDAFTKYTLRKVGDSMYAYINQVQLGSFPFQPFFGPNFGLGAGASKKGGLVKYDYIRISYLNQYIPDSLDSM